VQGDTEYGDVDWRDYRGRVCDSDILPGDDDGDGICAAGGTNWRRDWIATGDDGFRRSGVDVPAEAASGSDVRYFVAGGFGIGGLQ